jgi:hypothetical protein
LTRESFLLRTDPKVMNALRRWARDDLRSVNSQVEFLLRRALLDAGRLSQQALDTEDGAELTSEESKEKNNPLP